MDKYLLFAGDRYYAAGGWKDFSGCHSSQDQAVEAGKQLLQSLKAEWFQVVHLEIGKIVYEEGSSYS